MWRVTSPHERRVQRQWFWLKTLLGLLTLWAVVSIVLLVMAAHDRNVLMRIQRSQERVFDIVNQLPAVNTCQRTQAVPLSVLLVEPRDHPHLLALLDNVQRVLPGVPIQVLAGKHNVERLQRVAYETVTVHNMQCDNLTIDEYSSLLTRPQLYEWCEGDFILVVQTDVVLFEQSQVQLEAFYQFDYVGAPWRNESWSYRNRHLKQRVGNGGLSLRRKAAVIKALRETPYGTLRHHVNEDVFVVKALEAQNARFPSVEQAARFSFETIEADELPFGAHKFCPRRFAERITTEEKRRLLTT